MHTQSSFRGQQIQDGWTRLPPHRHKDPHCTPTHHRSQLPCGATNIHTPQLHFLPPLTSSPTSCCSSRPKFSQGWEARKVSSSTLRPASAKPQEKWPSRDPCRTTARSEPSVQGGKPSPCQSLPSTALELCAATRWFPAFSASLSKHTPPTPTSRLRPTSVECFMLFGR